MSSRLAQRFRSLGFIAAMFDAVSTRPGATALTRIPKVSSFQRQRACESLNSCLGAVLGHHVGLRKSGASEVDDCPASGFLHVWEYCSRGQKRAQKVIVQFLIQSSRLCSTASL